MKVVLELPQITSAVMEKWARLNGLELEEHLTELVKEDVRAIVKSVNPQGFDSLFGLDSVTVAIAAEMEGRDIGNYAPLLEGIGIEPGRISLRDNKLGCIAEVTFRNDSWYCDVDDEDSCVHIGFAMALGKVRETLQSLQARD